MPEVGRKEFAVLRVLAKYSEAVGASKIAKELREQGIELTERAIRYHLQALDQRGLTLNLGRSGRQLTEAGRRELANARVTDKLGLTLSRIDALAYLTTFDLRTGAGKVVLNVSFVRQADQDAVLKAMRPVLLSRYATSELIALFGPGQAIGDQRVPRGMVGVGTLSSVTLNGVLLHHGIPVNSEFGGLIEIAGHEPIRFTDIIRYGGTSTDPVELLIKTGATSAHSAVTTGSGKVGAGLRTCPSVARDEVLRLVDELSAWRIKGVIAAGGENQSLMEVPVEAGRMAFVVAAGLNALAAAEEAGLETTSQAMSALFEYEDLEEV